MKRLLVGLGTGTYCIQAAAVFHTSDTDGLSFALMPQIQSWSGVMLRSA